MKIFSVCLVLMSALLAPAQPLRSDINPDPASLPAASSTKGGSSKVVITVGGTKIQKQQIDTLVNLMIRARQTQGGTTPGNKPELEKMVATNLIGQELLDLEAKRLNVKAEVKDIDSLYRVFQANFPDDAAFRMALKAAGDSEKSLKDKLARQIRSDKVLNTQVPKVDRPTAREIADYYGKHKTAFPITDSLRACQILLLSGKSDKPGESAGKKARLEKIRAELAQDSGDADMLLTRFVLKARDVSEGPEKKDGGDLQRFRPNDFHAEFKKQVGPLRVGQLSPVFQTPLGWHLVLLTERYDGKAESYRLQISRLIVSEKAAVAGKNLRKYLQTLAARYRVNYLVGSYRDTSATGVYKL